MTQVYLQLFTRSKHCVVLVASIDAEVHSQRLDQALEMPVMDHIWTICQHGQVDQWGPVLIEVILPVSPRF